MKALRWYRSEDGPVAGVCKGLGESFDLPAGVVRLGFILVTLFGGSGIIAYVILALALPRKDRAHQALESKILGVCSWLSTRLEIEVGLIRVLALIAILGSFGLAVVAYIVGYFILPDAPSGDNIREV